jgi:hypothetical protein
MFAGRPTMVEDRGVGSAPIFGDALGRAESEVISPMTFNDLRSFMQATPEWRSDACST